MEGQGSNLVMSVPVPLLKCDIDFRNGVRFFVVVFCCCCFVCFPGTPVRLELHLVMSWAASSSSLWLDICPPQVGL